MQCRTIKIMEPEKAEFYRSTLAAMDWKEGKARTAELTGSIKKNKELKPGEDGEQVKALSNELCQMVAGNQDVASMTHIKQMMGFKFNNYDEPDGAYHRHTDAPWMGPVRTDFTAVLALTDPDTYEGGDHHVVDPLDGEIVLRPQAGELIIYETGYPHWVDPVNNGSRISALSWIESQVRTERQRGLLSTARVLSQELERAMFDTEDEELAAKFRKFFVDVGVVHSGLYRMWASR
jgi:PKHD-type hydroxylase